MNRKYRKTVIAGNWKMNKLPCEGAELVEALKAKGVKFEVRKVPSDASEDLDAMLKKAKAELAAQA